MTRRWLQVAGIAWLLAAMLTLLGEPASIARTSFGVSYAALGLVLIARATNRALRLSALAVVVSAVSLVSQPSIGSPLALVAGIVAAAFTVAAYDLANRAGGSESVQ